MASSILTATSHELTIVSLAIFVGACLIQILIMCIRHCFSSQPKQVYFHGHRVGRRLSEPYNSASDDEELPSQLTTPGKLQQGSHGVLSTLARRKKHDLKAYWQQSQQRTMLEFLISESHHRNRRSTYLVRSTFTNPVTYARLFAWQKSMGQKTILLGQVASLEDSKCRPTLRLALHPEDAEEVYRSGWGRPASLTVQKIISRAFKHDDTVEMLVLAPTTVEETELVTSVILDASIWWMVGRNDKEEV